jgi:hypothetical protein
VDIRFTPLTRDSEKVVTFFLYSSSTTIPAVVDGAAPLVELTEHVTRATQSPNELSVTISWHVEFFGANQPRRGQLLAARLGGTLLWVGMIDTVDDYRNQVGMRSMSLTARSRDASAAWRDVPRITPLYQQGTRLELIARQVASSLGLLSREIVVPSLGVHTVFSATQLAGISAWQMFEALLLPAGYYPRVDTIGRFRPFSRDTRRRADLRLGADRIQSINGSRSMPSLSRLRVKWVDPNLTYVAQQDQKLSDANMTAGFFQLRQRQPIQFSNDGTQRATATRMVIVQSANAGLIPICDETYEQTSETSAMITLETYAFVPILLAMMVAVRAAGGIPDIAPSFGGPTNPVGKRIHAALELGVLLILASIGTGSYEVWGTPYDYVHARNTTEAFVAGASSLMEKVEDLELDFIMNPGHARAVAGRELLYRVLSATSYGAEIVDDPRLEVGDIIELPDRSRLFITSYSRDLSHGSAAILNVQGFQV